MSRRSVRRIVAGRGRVEQLKKDEILAALAGRDNFQKLTAELDQASPPKDSTERRAGSRKLAFQSGSGNVG